MLHSVCLPIADSWRSLLSQSSNLPVFIYWGSIGNKETTLHNKCSWHVLMMVLRLTLVCFLLQAGYYCNVCECILRDSQSYLDHINGKYHNRALGMSMTVEKSTADDVRKKFEELKKDKDQPMPVDSVLDGMCLLLAFSMSTQQNIKVHFNKICSPTKQEPS